MRKKLWWLFVYGLTLVLLTACPQPQQPPPGDDNTGGGNEAAIITGYVVDSGAGAALAGTTVSAYGAGTDNLVASVTTADDGSYTLSLPEGDYDIRLQKDGYAGSQVLNVLAREGQTTPLNIIQRKAFNPSWPTEPPKVSLQGVNEGEVFDAFTGYIPYRIVSQPAGDLSTTLIYAALGKTPGSGFTTGFRSLFTSTNDTGMQYMDPFDYGAFGDTTFQVVVYDTNGNRTQLIRHVTVTGVMAPGNELVTPELRQVLAVTLATSVGFYNVGAEAAPAGGNLFTYVVWQPKYDFGEYPNDIPAGYHIWRSFDGKDFVQIGTVGVGSNLFIDASPDLAVGKTTYYRVTAFVGGGESEPSNVLSTTPLDMFSINLLSPADGETGVSTTPTFKWEMSDVGLYRYVGLVVWDTLSGDMAILAGGAQPFLVNRSSFSWNEDGTLSGTGWNTLQSGRSYEWEAYEAYAVDDAEQPTAVSIAADGFGIWFPYGIYGMPSGQHFTFTTAP